MQTRLQELGSTPARSTVTSPGPNARLGDGQSGRAVLELPRCTSVAGRVVRRGYEMKVVWVVLLAAFAMGCTSTRSAGVVVPIPAGGGTTYHLILGFGIVRVNDNNPSAAVVTDAQSFGLVVSDRPGIKLGVGYASSSVVSVPADAKDVRVEVSRQPWGPLRVEAPAAELGDGDAEKRDKGE
jgi:hypothetical protein